MSELPFHPAYVVGSVDDPDEFLVLGSKEHEFRRDSSHNLIQRA